jgi:hypothetical protein
MCAGNIRGKFREHSVTIQHAGNIQIKLTLMQRQQGPFRENSSYIGGTFREYSGNIERKFTLMQMVEKPSASKSSFSLS